MLMRSEIYPMLIGIPTTELPAVGFAQQDSDRVGILNPIGNTTHQGLANDPAMLFHVLIYAINCNTSR